jgi:hypothetical protein
MSLDIGKALRDGLDRTTARNGLVVAAVLVVFQLVSAVVEQSLTLVSIDGLLDDLAANPPNLEGTDLTTEEYQEAIANLRDAVSEMSQLAYLDSFSVPELLGLALLLAVVAEAIRIIAVRVFVSPETESISSELLTRNLLLAVVNGIVGGIVVLVLVAVGLFLLVVPGIFLAVAFVFLRQEIAVEDKNFVAALSGSWDLTSGNRLELFGLFVFLIVISLVAGFVAGLIGPSVLGAVINTAVSAVVLTYSVAVISRAYDQLRVGSPDPVEVGSGPEEGSGEFEDIDDDLLP